jgi:hypothetical protein
MAAVICPAGLKNNQIANRSIQRDLAKGGLLIYALREI